MLDVQLLVVLGPDFSGLICSIPDRFFSPQCLPKGTLRIAFARRFFTGYYRYPYAAMSVFLGTRVENRFPGKNQGTTVYFPPILPKGEAAISPHSISRRMHIFRYDNPETVPRSVTRRGRCGYQIQKLDHENTISRTASCCHLSKL